MTLPVLALAATFATPAMAQDAPPPIVNGDTTSDYGAVGALVACYSSSSCGQFCSGTLIENKWVISAAHCAEGMSSYDIYFVTGRNVYNSVDDYDTVKRLLPHPDYNDRTLQHDIAIFELDNGITSEDTIPPNEETVNNTWYNKELTYVGYGVTSDNANDSGYKRYAQIPVADYDSQFIYGLDTEDEQNVCYGDSGGAALETVSGGYELAGVNSFVAGYLYSNSACVGGYSGATRVDAYIDWFEEYFELTGGSSSGDGGSSSGDGGSSSGDGGSSSGDGGSSSGDGGSSSGDGGGGDDTGPTDEPDRPDDDDDDDDDSSPSLIDILGCSTVPVPAFGAFVLSMLALAGRRRRQDG